MRRPFAFAQAPLRLTQDGVRNRACCHLPANFGRETAPAASAPLVEFGIWSAGLPAGLAG